VSIILPTFNRREFLRAAVESIFAQTWTDWQLIIADDGSDADTRAYLEGLEDCPRVRLMCLPHTGRPSVVRNRALREARGQYVAFLDSDDVWLPAKLALQIASLRARSSCKWSYTKFVLVDESGNPTAWALRTGGWPTPSGWILEKLIRAETSIALPTVVVSRELLEKIGGFDERLIGSEDYELHLRLAQQSEVIGITEPLTLVRRHTQHFSGQGVIPFESNLLIIDRLLRSERVEHLRDILYRKRAEVAAGLARSHASAGHRGRAMRALAGSARHSWRYPRWWLAALETTARALAPGALRQAARGYRNERRAQDGASDDAAW